MKKTCLSLIIITLSIFVLPISVFAQAGPAMDAIKNVVGTIAPPQQINDIGYGGQGINRLLGNVVTIIFALSGIAAVFMVIISAIQFIFSGGDKEAVGKAKGRLTYAIIGLVVLALAFWIVNLVGTIAGFNFFNAPFPAPRTPGMPLGPAGQ